MKIRACGEPDLPEILRMSQALFPQESVAGLEEGMRDFLLRPDAHVFVAERPDGTLAGYVQVGSRAYADGCETSPVGYVEEWFVDDDVRRAGVGRALLAAAEDWARSRGYHEMASDALLDNEISHRAHEGAGYVEVERAIRFRKPL